ncbi:phage portal protein [Gemella haemolysans]|uniref:phage portal protein n=1 Tax=Gemella haemolysans TaxID=1379 RepID=UPI002379FA3F|nr:phage portal protein [Gemella haemolysans]
MQLLTYPRVEFDEKNIKKELVVKLIREHEKQLPRFKKLKKYYLGEHDILNKQRSKNKPNYKPVCNHAKDIADTSTGYFMGNTISYSNSEDTDIDELLIAFDNAEVDESDHDNALDMAIYGVAYEYVYARENENILDIKSLEVENTFIVYDDSIEQQPLFGVYYFKRKENKADTETYQAVIMTKQFVYSIVLEGKEKGVISDKPVPHNMGDIPIIEYKNNKYLIGDFEQQIGLIDSYNSLTANRINDKEQFIDSILVLYGARLGDDEEESIKAMESLAEHKLLELHPEARAEYLSKTLNENEVETLRNAVKQDIYTFSHIPNLTDENFAGNSSGVAMEFKLLGLEMITKIKQRYYVKGLKKRIKLFANYLGLTQIAINANSIVPNFSRSLPKNLLEISQIVSNLDGKVSQETLLSQIPFVEDPMSEIEKVNEEKQENIAQNQLLLTGGEHIHNTPVGDEVDEQEEQRVLGT